jgi:hypothetical protein
MSAHLRHCPKHRKPLPCTHCALVAKPAQIPPTAVVESPPKSAAAIRGQKWRDKQKLQDPDFKKKEAERKQSERDELRRKEVLEQALKSGQFPVNLVALRKKEGRGLFLTEAPAGVGKITTGGYDTRKLGEVKAKNTAASRKSDPITGISIATPVAPSGASPDNANPDVRQGYLEIPPKEIRAMRRFIQNRVNEKPMMICLICDEQISPEFSFADGFLHLRDRHPELFDDMMDEIRATLESKITQCTQDHEALLKRYLEHRAQPCHDPHCRCRSRKGKHPDRLYCRECKKWLNRPVSERSDKTRDTPKAA